MFNVFLLFLQTFGESFVLTRNRRYPGRSGGHNLFLSEPFVGEQKRLLSRSTGKKLAKRGDAAIMGRARKLFIMPLRIWSLSIVRNFFRITSTREINTRRVYISCIFIRASLFRFRFVCFPFRVVRRELGAVEQRHRHDPHLYDVVYQIHSFLPFYIFFTSIKSFRDLITSISRKLFDEISGYSIKMETESSTKRQASIPPTGIDGGRLSLPLVL